MSGKPSVQVFLGKTVTVKIDRPLGSMLGMHNYGFIPGAIAPDGSELDPYVLGVDQPVRIFIGKCIAIFHRTTDEDDKRVVVPEGQQFSDEQIRAWTDFQERFFKSFIQRPE